MFLFNIIFQDVLDVKEILEHLTLYLPPATLPRHATSWQCSQKQSRLSTLSFRNLLVVAVMVVEAISAAVGVDVVVEEEAMEVVEEDSIRDGNLRS